LPSYTFVLEATRGEISVPPLFDVDGGGACGFTGFGKTFHTASVLSPPPIDTKRDSSRVNATFVILVPCPLSTI
jgi:hypothetical protein